MAFGKESLQQVQQLKLQQRLNPQTVALGRLLEMSVPELEDEIRREIDDNPALESRDSLPESHSDESFGESAEELQMADYASADDMPSYMLRARNRSADDSAVDPTSFAADDGDSLITVLMGRLAGENRLSDDRLRIAEHIIGNFDSNGYLTRPLAAIAQDIAIAEGFEPSRAEMTEVFSAIRALDPPGIGAVDLRDSLLLQLDRLAPTVQTRTAREIVADYFDLFSKKHYDRLIAQLEISRDDLAEALDIIRSLNPKPASALDIGVQADRARHITPDLTLDYDADNDRFTVGLAGNIPELAIEESFAANPDEEAAMSPRMRQAGAFIRRKRDDANAFIRLVEARGNTLLTIMKAIAAIQRPFFISGDRADIRPMILRDIADRTGLDLPLISRATAGKYVMTAHGIFPLKLFFNERPDADTDVSSHEILETLATVINGEDKHSPLSDRELCDALHDAGYDIARRTVAKYREKLGFPVARLRKQL